MLCQGGSKTSAQLCTPHAARAGKHRTALEWAGKYLNRIYFSHSASSSDNLLTQTEPQNLIQSKMLFFLKMGGSILTSTQSQ